MTIRVAIVEDQRIVKEILGSLLGRESDIVVVGAASNGKEAFELARERVPDVLLLDISLPDIDGIAVARAVRAEQPSIRLIALSVHTETHVVDEMLEAGARGYVTKSAGFPDLLDAIRAVAQGRIYLSAGVAREAAAEGSEEPPDARLALGRGASLGRREREVLGLIASGRRSPDIARSLGISVATVEVHRRNIMRKLDIHTVAELTKFAVRAGLTSL